jgi:hypothetical protein
MSTVMGRKRNVPRKGKIDARRRTAPVAMAEQTPGALYRLMAWLSPAYPVGAFSYSSGIEWAVETGDIRNAESLKRWLTVVIGEGGGFSDAVFFARGGRTRGGLRAVEGASSGDDGARPRVLRGDEGGVAMRGAGSSLRRMVW